MIFVPNKSVIGLYGSGRCVKHLSNKSVSKNEIKDAGGKVDETDVDNILKSKPQMDNIIKRLNNLKSLKRRKVVFDI